MPSPAKKMTDEKPKNAGRYWDDFLFARNEINRLIGEMKDLRRIIQRRDPDFDFEPYEITLEDPVFSSVGDVILHILRTQGETSIEALKKQVVDVLPQKAPQFKRSLYQLKDRDLVEETNGRVRALAPRKNGNS